LFLESVFHIIEIDTLSVIQVLVEWNEWMNVNEWMKRREKWISEEVKKRTRSKWSTKVNTLYTSNCHYYTEHICIYTMSNLCFLKVNEPTLQLPTICSYFLNQFNQRCITLCLYKISSRESETWTSATHRISIEPQSTYKHLMK